MMIGEIEKGLEVFAAVRDRYRGHNRNPWNEIECGSNYSRSMASYAALLVLSGFAFDMAKGHIGFDPKIRQGDCFRSLWSTGTGWGEIRIEDGMAVIDVVGGSLSIGTVSIQGITFDAAAIAAAAQTQVSTDRVMMSAGMAVTLRNPGISIAQNEAVYAA
jgi:hypothetical protein